MQEAQKFLSRILPWPPQGQPGAYHNLHWSFTSDGKKKLAWGGSAHTDLAGMLSSLKYQLKRGGTQGMYVCMSSQRVSTQAKSKNGWNYQKAERSSTAAVELKSFFIDVDVKESAYASTKEAIVALVNFVKVMELPQPNIVVGTGSGGFHAHWVVETPMKPEVWRPYAFALAEATKKHGLIVDTGCTIDAARIMRVPDTFNTKSGEPKPVKLMGYTDADYPNKLIYDKLEPYNVAEPQTKSSFKLPAAFDGARRSSDPIPISDLAAGISWNSRPVKLLDVATECKFIGDALVNGGSGYDNVLWNLTTLAATFAEDGREYAHEMSKGHKDYTAAETDALYTRKFNDRVENSIGWPQCKTIAGSGCLACQTCPHLKSGKSPLNFARVSDEIFPDISGMPSGYMQDTNNMIYHLDEKDEGKSVQRLVMPYPVSNGRVEIDPYTLYFLSKPTIDGERQIALPYSTIDGGAKLFNAFSEQGLLINGRELKVAGRFLVAWANELKKIRSSVVNTSTAYGWVVEDGQLNGFAYSGVIHTPKGPRTAANGSPSIALHYRPKGTIAPWRTAVKLMTDQRRPELELMIASSFAGPLMRFTGLPGVLISAYSVESGIGKSSAMKVAQSVWGDPMRAMQTLDDTTNSVLSKMGELKSLPIFWDELKTDADIDKFVKLAFNLAQGREKNRLDQQMKQRDSGTWETVLTVASNDSLVDSMTSVLKGTEAGVMRLFEFAVTPGVYGKIEQGNASQILQGTHDNYGHAGEIYAKFLGKSHEKIKVDMLKCINNLNKVMGTDTKERFWVAAASTVIMGAVYANDLGLTNFDLVGLTQLCKKTIKDMRDISRETDTNVKSKDSIWNVLTQFLTAMQGRHTLWTDIIPTNPGRPNKAEVLKSTQYLDGVYVQIALTTGILRLSKTRLSDWLRDKRYSQKLFIDELKSQFGFRYLNAARMGSGTDFSTGNQYLLESTFVGTPLHDWVESMDISTTKLNKPDQPKERRNEPQ